MPTNIMNFDLSRKINNINLGGGDVKNCYRGSNLVKEIYLGDKLLKINDHRKLQIETSNSYISNEPINETSTFINVTLKDNYSQTYVYINFINENNELYVETNTQAYTITKIDTDCQISKATPPHGLMVYTTGYINFNETRKLTYLDVYSQIYPETKLHRYCIQCIRKPNSGSTIPSTQSFDYNIWIATINSTSSLYSFSLIGYKPSTNTYHYIIGGGGGDSTIFNSGDTYLRYRYGNSSITSGTIYISYLLCVSKNLSVHYSNDFNTAWNIIQTKNVNRIKNEMQLFSNTPEQYSKYTYKYVANENFILLSSLNICVTDK